MSKILKIDSCFDCMHMATSQINAGRQWCEKTDSKIVNEDVLLDNCPLEDDPIDKDDMSIEEDKLSQKEKDWLGKPTVNYRNHPTKGNSDIDYNNLEWRNDET